MTFKMKSFEQVSYSMINWMNNTVNTLTDFSVGSKIRTLLETVALEVEELYFRSYKSVAEAQVEGVYEAFDFTKKPASKATGVLTVWRDTPDPSNDYTLGIGMKLATGGTETERMIMFETTENKTLYTMTGITETLTFSTTLGATSDVLIPMTQRFVSSLFSITGYVLNTDYELYTDPVGIRDQIKWKANQNRPLNGATFIIKYYPLSVDIAVTCLENGIVGNVSYGKVITLYLGVVV